MLISPQPTVSPPVRRRRGVLLVAAGAAFLALLDTTVANLAVADVRSGDDAGRDRRRGRGAPERFAAAVGLNQTGRQVGGALGVAALAALLEGSGSGVGPFEHVYLFCTLATFAVAVTALWLVTKERR